MYCEYCDTVQYVQFAYEAYRKNIERNPCSWPLRYDFRQLRGGGGEPGFGLII
jgi:hypothetical protein